MRTRSFLALALLALSGASASAQDPTDYAAYYPTHARGHVNTIFDAGGIDDINLFTGHLTSWVPGPTVWHFQSSFEVSCLNLSLKALSRLS